MGVCTKRLLTRRRFAGALLGAFAVMTVGIGPACGDDSRSTAGTRDDPFPVKDPRSRCGNLGTSC